MKEWAAEFYSSDAWKKTRRAYRKSVGGLCERCLDRGEVRAGEIVHHIRHLTPENIHDPKVTLSWDNLQLLCRDCHAQIHTNRERRWRVDEFGRVVS